MKIPAKNGVMRVTNLALLVCGSFLAGSGWMLAERLPHGGRGHAMTMLGLNRHGWQEGHELAGYVVIGLVLLHLVLNWNWLVVIAASRTRWRLIGGLLVGAGIAGLFAFAPIAGE